MSDNFFGSLPSVTKNLLIINVLCFFADYVLESRFGISLTNLFGLHYFLSPVFFIWQPLTYMFMHANFSHLFFNMFAVFMFAPPLEQRWGSKRFLTYYLFSGVGAACVQTFVWWLMFGEAAALHVTIGASGAVFGILFAFGWLFPDVRMFVFPIPIPIRARVFVIIYALIELFAGLANVSGDNVAHFAHLGGMLFGWILLLWWRRNDDNNIFHTNYTSPTLEKLRNWWKQHGFGSKRQEKEYTGYHYQDPVRESKKENDDKEIERILEKIKTSGYSSLTDEERAKIFK